MSLFKEMLKGGESIFRDTVSLDYDFQPRILKYRENEQMRFAAAIRPLLQGHNGRNLFIHGAPGIGKTTACRHVLRELEEETDEVIPIFINCWKLNSTYKVFYSICEQLGFAFIQNKRTQELFTMVKQKLNKKAAVFVFDEVDKLEDTDFLYSILEDIYRKAVFVITNFRDSYVTMDKRIQSRLSPEFLFFRSYNESEIEGVLKERREYAFVPGCWNEEAWKELVEKCTETRDVRVGLFLMREAGNSAEEAGLRKVGMSQVAAAVKRVDDFHVKPKDALSDELEFIWNLVRDNNGEKIGEMYEKYTVTGGKMSYKTFQRRINKLSDGGYIKAEKINGKEGNTTLLHYGKNLG